MMPRIVAFLSATLAATGFAAEPPPQAPLRAADGPVIALAQQASHPNKPYIAQLFAPGAPPLPLLDDSPSDHFHHHGLMFGLNVDDTDFWVEKDIDNAGHQKVVETTATPEGDGFTQRLSWRTTDGTALVDESRRVRVRATGTGADAVHWLDWETTLTPAAGRAAVRLSGEIYHGLGMRFLPEWAEKSEFIRADPAIPPANRGRNVVVTGDWCAVRCTIQGQPVTVLMIAHPANPRPGEWFWMNRPFCYLTATLNLKNEPHQLASGESWSLRYGIAVLSAAADHDRLANLAAAWRTADPPATENPPTPAKP